MRQKQKRRKDSPERIKRFINAYRAEHGNSPSYRDIGAALGLHYTTVRYHIDILRLKGEVTLTTSRSVKVVSSGASQSV